MISYDAIQSFLLCETIMSWYSPLLEWFAPPFPFPSLLNLCTWGTGLGWFVTKVQRTIASLS